MRAQCYCGAKQQEGKEPVHCDICHTFTHPSYVDKKEPKVCQDPNHHEGPFCPCRTRF